jgi:demethylphylloquinone reductase
MAPSIVILGGGFGGLHTALRLSEFPWSDGDRPNIVLVDQNPHFLFLPLLYELVTNELDDWEIAPPFSELLANTKVQFRQDTVQAIDLAQQQIALHSGETLTYDRLVLALGGETPLNIVPGAAEHALPFRSLTDAQQLKDRLQVLESSDKDVIRVAVVGGGPSGVELACKLADRLGSRGRIRLIERDDGLLKKSPAFNQTAAQKALDQRGVWINLDTTIQQVNATDLVLTYKEQEDTIPIDLVLWTVGNAIAPPLKDLPVPHTPDGRIRTDVTLQVTEHANLFALGDLADCKDAYQKPVPTTAQSAIQQADCVAWNVWASLSDRPLLPFRYTHLGEMLTLGTDTAALAGLGLTLDGPFAYLARRLIYLYRMPTLEHQLKVGLNWVFKPLLEVLRSASSNP